MADYIINASPTIITRGTEDKSIRPIPVSELPQPQHLPKFYIWAEKGPTTPQLSGGGQVTKLFGDKTFTLGEKYYNHATHFALAAMSRGNTVMLERLIPSDAGPEANVALYIDVLPTQVDDYQRNSDGSIATDANGTPIVVGQITGYKIKWVSEVDTAGDQWGSLTVKTGTQTDPTTGTQSQMYPVLQFKASYIGEYGNNVGLRILPMVGQDTPSELVNAVKSFPFSIQVVRRANAGAAPQVVKTIYGSDKVQFFLKPDAQDPATGKNIHIGKTFIPAYNNTTDPRYPLEYGDIGELYVYQNNIDTLVEQFQASEAAVADAFTDFTASLDEKYMVNIFTAVNTNGAPYHSIVLVDDADAIRWTSYTNVFLGGGSDGTMNEEAFNTLVAQAMEKYADPNSEYQDPAINVESAIWDSGFTMETKKALAKFISLRKDTFVVLSTHVDGEKAKDVDTIASRALALRTYLLMYPESTYFGTPAARGVVVGGSYIDREMNYNGRLPLSLSLLRRVAMYMGSGTGAWKSGAGFDRAPNNVINDGYDVQPAFIPAGSRNRFWDSGLVWAQPYDRKSYFFPAVQTVYPDDSSVLNGFYTVVAIAYLNKVAYMVWREFTGSTSLTNAQLIERVKQSFIEKTKGKFDNVMVVRPNVEITEDDAARGYSWTVTIDLYAPNMKSVMTFSIRSWRSEDLAQ